VAKKAEPLARRLETDSETLREYADELKELSDILLRSARVMDQGNVKSCHLLMRALTGTYLRGVHDAVKRIESDVDVQVSAAIRGIRTRIDYSVEERDRRNRKKK